MSPPAFVAASSALLLAATLAVLLVYLLRYDWRTSEWGRWLVALIVALAAHSALILTDSLSLLPRDTTAWLLGAWELAGTIVAVLLLVDLARRR